MPIFRSRCCAVLAMIALAPVSSSAFDSGVDSSFAPTSAQPGWRRAYDNPRPTDHQRFVAAARAPDGGYVLAGKRLVDGQSRYLIFLAKFRPNGDYDIMFGGTPGTGNAGVGRVLKDANFTTVTDMTIDAQGRIVVIGPAAGALGQSDFGVVRFNSNGTDDTSFSDGDGAVIGFDLDYAHNRTNDEPMHVTTTPDGAVYVAGTVQATYGGAFTTRVGVAKLNGYGTPYYAQVLCSDICQSGAEFKDVAGIVYDAPRNRLVIGGNFIPHSAGWFLITQDLGAAATVKTAAYAISQGIFHSDRMTKLAMQSDGKIVALGYTCASNSNCGPNVMLRTQPISLAEDTSFGNTPGRGLSLFESTPDVAYWSFAIDSSGRFILAGNNYSFFWGAARRLRANGSVDSSFNDSISPSSYFAETTSGSSAYSTSFREIFLDGGRPVLAGEAPDSHTDFSDYDLIITRLQSDTLFANGFQ